MSLEIIIKKVSKLVGVPGASVLTFGDVRHKMAQDLLKMLTDIIEKKAAHPRPYFILVHAGPDRSVPGGNVIKERLIILNEAPKTRFIGTILFRIDNRLADATLEWCLPMDIPGLMEPESGERKGIEGARTVVESMQGLPIINRSAKN